MAGGVGRHPDVVVALQVAALIAATLLSSWLATYTVPVTGLRLTQIGRLPTGVVGGAWPQPEGCWALQAAVLISETLPSKVLAAYSVPTAGSTARSVTPLPAVTVAWAFPQPEVCWALQVAALITETEPSPLFATYTVCVAGSVITPVGLAPTWTVVWG